MAFIYIANIMNSVNKSIKFDNNCYYLSVNRLVILYQFYDIVQERID
jgi:hypothetical protein